MASDVADQQGRVKFALIMMKDIAALGALGGIVHRITPVPPPANGRQRHGRPLD
jgi:hypothetical protein